MISSHHLAAVISLGIALLEFEQFGPAYAEAIIANTTGFAGLLADAGLTLAAADRGYSAGHQLWLDTEADGVPPSHASERLSEAGLLVNYMAGLPGFTGQGMRVGLNEATYHGLSKEGIPGLAEIFVAAVTDTAPACVLARRTAELRETWAARSTRTPQHDRAAALLEGALPLAHGAAELLPSTVAR